jgi:predicted O-methyltransferase YrrM
MSETNYIFTVDWFSANIHCWTHYLKEFKGKPNLRFLEIGSYQGRSTVWLLENILTDDSSTITCIDTFEGSAEHHECNECKKDLVNLFDIFSHNISAFSNKVNIIRDKSQVALKRITEEYDFIYVDGVHKASAVIEDAILSFHLLKNGGMMIFDDYEWSCSKTLIDDPKPAIDAFMLIYEDKIKVLLVNPHQVIIQKI